MADNLAKKAWRYRYVILAVLTFAYLIQYMDRSKTSILLPLIRTDLNMTHAQAGLAISAALWLYAPMQLVAGLLADKFGSKKLTLLSIAGFSVFTFWMSICQTFSSLFTRQIIFGVFNGFEFVPSGRVINRWFPVRLRAKANAIFAWSWVLGPAIAPLIATWLAAAYGWRMCFVILALVGIVPFMLVALLVHNRPEEYKHITTEELKESYEDDIAAGTISMAELEERRIRPDFIINSRVPLKQILTNDKVIMLAVFNAVTQFCFWGISSWLPSYLFEVHKFKLASMGSWMALYYFAGAIGVLLAGYISDNIFKGRRRPVLMLSMFGFVPFFIILALLPVGVNATILFAILSLTGFFFTMHYAPFLSYSAEFFTPEVYGACAGFVGFIGYIGAMLAPIVGGYLIKTGANGPEYGQFFTVIAICGLFCGWLGSRIKDSKDAAKKAAVA